MIILLMVLMFADPTITNSATLLDFNSGSGTTLTGWTWYDGDPTGADDFGSPGWRKDDGAFYSGGTSNWYPRLFEKSDYAGTSNLGAIITDDISPSTSSGGALKIYQDTNSTANQVMWWYFYNNRFEDLGYSTSTSNRMDFYVKVSYMDEANLTRSTNPKDSMHFGTYLCADGWCYQDALDAQPIGKAGADYESWPENAPGDRHYYHYLTIPDGAWYKVSLDPTPAHLRGATASESPHEPLDNYFQDLNSFYFEIRMAQTAETSYIVDEMNIWEQIEPENGQSVTSVYVGYDIRDDKWRMGWVDKSFLNGSDGTTQSTFEVRYSSSVITNANYQAATIVSTHEIAPYDSNTKVRRPNVWNSALAADFTLPDDFETNNDNVYFAIKDVSLLINGDGHDAPTNLIRTIDYALRSQSRKPSPWKFVTN